MGRPKKANEKQRGTLTNKQNMPFSSGETSLFLQQRKERKKKQHKKKQTPPPKKKEGLGPSKVALRATSPDP